MYSDEELAGIAFAGETLGPLFSEDPLQGGAGAVYDALATLDVERAAREWPFVVEDEARGFLSLMQRGIASGMEGVAGEYRRLFVGPAKKAAPPWGSVYTDRDGVMFGRSALDLHDWLMACGVEVTADDRMPDDHIGRMLSLMAWMARKRPELLGELLSAHLLTWAPHFLQRVRSVTVHPFFEGLSTCTQRSLEGIRNAGGLEVTSPRFYR